MEVERRGMGWNVVDSGGVWWNGIQCCGLRVDSYEKCIPYCGVGNPMLHCTAPQCTGTRSRTVGSPEGRTRRTHHVIHWSTAVKYPHRVPYPQSEKGRVPGDGAVICMAFPFVRSTMPRLLLSLPANIS